MSESHSKPQDSAFAEYAPGPLVVCAANSRYFTVATNSPVDQKAVYLTGSHIWNNFHDGLGPGLDCSGSSEQNDYGAYLTFLKEHGHNFIRLWRWEQFKSQAATASFHLCMTPQPWPRTGRARISNRWQAEVRPFQVRSTLLQPVAQPYHRRRQGGDLRLGHALRRIRPPLEQGTRPHRRPSVRCC